MYYDSIEKYATKPMTIQKPSTFFMILSKCLVGLAVVVSFYTIAKRTDLVATIKNTANFVELNEYTITLSSSSPDYGTLTTLADLPWTMVVEPHRLQNVAVDSLLLGDKEMDVSLYTTTRDFAGQSYTG